MSEKKSVTRAREFTFLVYEDSAPDNWFEILQDFRIPCFVSPYHSKDLNPTGEPKKPHWHIMLMYEGPKSLSQVQKVSDALSGVQVLFVESKRGMARYLCHLDNPDKFQYNPWEVRSLYGADYYGCCTISIDRYKCITEMIEFVDENNIYSFATLVRYARDNNQSWFRCLTDNSTVFMKEYLKSKLWEDSRTS